MPAEPDPQVERWDPEMYADLVASIDQYGPLQDELAAAADAVEVEVGRILDLGTGTGETARRVLEGRPGATLVGVDASEEMLAEARRILPAERAGLVVARLEDPLPEGEFDLVVSALAVHHLDGPAKADLFGRIADRLVPGGRFVLADVVLPDDPDGADIELTSGYDQPDTVTDQMSWLADAGLTATCPWRHDDLAVIVADRSK